MNENEEKLWLERLDAWGVWARSHATRNFSSLWLVMKQATPQQSSSPEISAAEAFAIDRLIVRVCSEPDVELLRARFVKRRSVRWIEEHLRISHREFRARLRTIIQTLDKCGKIIIIARK